MKRGGELLVDGNVTVNLERCLVVIGSKEISLTATECAILNYLIAGQGRTVSREVLMQKVWGGSFEGTTRLNTHVQRLRQKLGKAAKALQTVRGAGYRWKCVRSSMRTP